MQLADNYIEKIKTGDHPKTFLSYEKIINKYLGVPAHIYIKKVIDIYKNSLVSKFVVVNLYNFKKHFCCAIVITIHTFIYVYISELVNM